MQACRIIDQTERQVRVGLYRRKRSDQVLGSYTDDRAGPAVDLRSHADDGRARVEAALPIPVAEHGKLFGPRLLAFAGTEEPAQCRLHPKELKKVAGSVLRQRAFRVIAG